MDSSQTQIIEDNLHQLREKYGYVVRISVPADTAIMKAADSVLDWFQGDFKEFLLEKFSQATMLGRWADRISTTVAQLIFMVARTLIKSLEVLFTRPEFWTNAFKTAKRAWDQNKGSGVLAQTYAYCKKMAGYLLEVFKQCLEKSIKTHGLEMSVDEKEEISKMIEYTN